MPYQLCFCFLDSTNLALLGNVTSCFLTLDIDILVLYIHYRDVTLKQRTQREHSTILLNQSCVFCPYLRLLDKLSSVSLVTRTWVEPPWLSSCITSIWDTQTNIYSTYSIYSIMKTWNFYIMSKMQM